MSRYPLNEERKNTRKKLVNFTKGKEEKKKKQNVGKTAQNKMVEINPNIRYQIFDEFCS